MIIRNVGRFSTMTLTRRVSRWRNDKLLCGETRFVSSQVCNRRFSTESSSGLDVVLKSIACVRGENGVPEAQKYLDKFQEQYKKGTAFAVIKVGGDVVEYEMKELTETCAALHRLGLLPVVIHGGGPQMNDELARKGVEPEYIRGSRVTDEVTLEVASRIFKGLNQRVVDALQNLGVPAVGLADGIFNAEIKVPELKFVGEIESVNEGPIVEALAAGQVPVLTSLGVSSEGQELNINADVAARDLVLSLKPHRVLFASAKGGWLDEETGEVVNSVDLSNEYDALASIDYTGRQGTLLKLNEIKLILDSVPPSTSVAIASAPGMLTELFTQEGSGTMFIKGQKVDIKGDDEVREFTYGDKVVANVLNKPKLGKDLFPILTEFYVAPDARGLGHEGAVWKAIKEEYETLAWVIHSDQPDNSALSVEHADGTLIDRNSGATVAWYNRGHPLKGWGPDLANRIFPDSGSSDYDSPTRSAATVAAAASSADGKVYKVGLLGARGYVGREFVKLLVDHPLMELTVASSRALAGQPVIECFGLDASASNQGVKKDLLFQALEPEDLAKNDAAREVDIWVLALPNGLAPKFVAPIEAMSPNSVMIDLSADFRFDDTWTYGLPERHGAREKLRGTKRISNPGCYATGAQVGLMPLLQPLPGSGLGVTPGVAPQVFGVSGYSGAGTNPSDKNDPACLKDNILPYSLVNHIHERECSRHLTRQIGFMPHVAPYFQGIHLTMTAQLDEETRSKLNGDSAAIVQAYQDYYANQPLIKVSEIAPVVRDNMRQHHVAVGGFTLDPATGRLAFCSTIDNLLKGAATQAVQNLNIALLEPDQEYLGIF